MYHYHRIYRLHCILHCCFVMLTCPLYSCHIMELILLLKTRYKKQLHFWLKGILLLIWGCDFHFFFFSVWPIIGLASYCLGQWPSEGRNDAPETRYRKGMKILIHMRKKFIIISCMATLSAHYRVWIYHK